MNDFSQVRMPNGVMDYLEHDATPVEQAEAEAAAAAGDPETYERALERHRTHIPAVRYSGRPMMTIITEALGKDES